MGSWERRSSTRVGKSIQDEREAHHVGERVQIEACMDTELSEGDAEIDKEA